MRKKVPMIFEGVKKMPARWSFGRNKRYGASMIREYSCQEIVKMKMLLGSPRGPWGDKDP
jgi:hypothetical protein